MKTIIAGSRTLGAAHLASALLLCPWTHEISIVVSGCAPGIDIAGEDWAWRRRLPIERHFADWKRFGRGAGPMRNREMANSAEALLAVHDGRSPGTADMIAVARARRLRVFVHVVR